MMTDDDSKNGDNIHRMYPGNAADNPDYVLEQSIGQFSEVLVLGWDKEGLMSARCSNSLSDGDLNLMIDIFKKMMIDKYYS